jgi:hypothetical protein
MIISITIAVTPAHGSETLCMPGEVKLFACAVKTKGKNVKIASLCASNDLSESGGFLYYRFGSKHQVEMSFSDSPTHPKENFRRGLMNYSDANGDFVWFSKGEYSYTMYSWAKGNPSVNGEGVKVRKSGKVIADLGCITPALSENG